MVILIGLAAASLPAEEPPVHYLHQGTMPPGAIGSRQLQRGGPLLGFFQPVQIKAPDGVMVSTATGGQFDRSQAVPLRAGMLIGQVYRLRVTNIPRHQGMEVFPSVEVIDRLYTPASQQHRFAIPIELTQEDLQLALAGKFVTRVIYLENPRDALPVRGDTKPGSWFDIGPGRDPLVVADSLGRPVAILRMGGRVPDANLGPDRNYLFGCPPLRKAAAKAPQSPQP